LSLLDDETFLTDLDSNLSSRAIAQMHGIKSKSTVNEYRAKRRAQIAAMPITPEKPAAGESEEHRPDGSADYTRFSETPWGYEDHRDFIRSKGQDPDKVTFTWGLTTRPGGGFWNKLNNVRPIEGVDNDLVSVDPIGVLARLRAESPIRSGDFELKLTGDGSAFCLSINDVQLGQSYNGGSAATIANFYRFIELAKERILELRLIGRKLEGLVVVVGGDLGEGCVIYPNQSFSLDLDRKQQIEGIVGLLLHAIDTLAPMFEWVKVLACKGNHGEHRINGKMTTLGDNDDTHAVEMAKLALSRDPNMQHIEWVIAEEEAAVWVEVHGWTLVTTHGDVFAKGVSGTTTERKAHAWFKNMAAAVRRFGRVGQADVLITHHFHHDERKDWGDTLWRQTPSQDRGSPGFSQASGTYSEPGMLTWVMTPTSRYKDEAILT
jgi:hypothetical protein